MALGRRLLVHDPSGARKVKQVRRTRLLEFVQRRLLVLDGVAIA